jgi:hypothetical protein
MLFSHHCWKLLSASFEMDIGHMEMFTYISFISDICPQILKYCIMQKQEAVALYNDKTHHDVTLKAE